MAAVQKEPAIEDDPFAIPQKILDAELDAIGGRRFAVGLDGKSLANRLVGLALSGGGIRSATFSLGVLQRLAQENLLKYVDYLSTVSGGGYIGGSVTWLLSRTKQPDATGAGFPFCQAEPNVLTHLRLHGKYLTPGQGITAMSLVAVILRGIVLNLVVWLPLAVAFLAGVLKLSPSIEAFLSRVPHIEGDLTGLGYLTCLGITGVLFLLLNLLYSLATRRPFRPPDPYLWRRRFERGVRWLLWAGLAFFVLGSLPLLSGWLQGYGYGSVLIGITGGLWSFVRSARVTRTTSPVAVLAPLASILILYGLAFASYEIAQCYLKSHSEYANWALAAAVLVSLATGWHVNLNYISIHRYYRDRLMEAFMPRPDTDGTTAAATEADKAKLSDMCTEHAPYHLVNTNVVLVDTDDRRWRVRGGDAFLLSPKYCGGTATGWVPTADYMKRDPLTLATAVAISGAAANPNTGVGGAGPTRQPMLSLLMGLLNVRLGYWVPRPGARQKMANHFLAARHELSPRGYAENRKLLQLSDGGHFENLGVYELVRRRVKLIICCDAGADPEFAFTDLQVLMRRIRTDFGAQIEFNDDNRLERVIPRKPDHAYPVGTRFSERAYVKGTIVYSDKSESTLIVLKTTMIPGLSLLLKGYKGANPAFPDQSTADQFFDEEQFEAYRELGYELAGTMINDQAVDLKGLLVQCAS